MPKNILTPNPAILALLVAMFVLILLDELRKRLTATMLDYIQKLKLIMSFNRYY